MKKEFKKPRVSIALPLRFLRRGEIGYILLESIILVIKEEIDPKHLKIACYIQKSACFVRTPSPEFIRIERIGYGFEGEDFLLSIPSSLHGLVVHERKAFERSNLFKHNHYLSPIEVDWFMHTEVSLPSHAIDFSRATFPEIMNWIKNYESSHEFALYEQSLPALFTVIPQKLEAYLLTLDGPALNLFYQDFRTKKRDSEKLVESSLKTSLFRFYTFVLRSTGIFLRKKGEDINFMTPEELQKAYEAAEYAQEYEKMGPILDRINQLAEKK